MKGKKLFLGGIKIPYHSGLKGHSDGEEYTGKSRLEGSDAEIDKY